MVTVFVWEYFNRKQLWVNICYLPRVIYTSKIVMYHISSTTYFKHLTYLYALQNIMWNLEEVRKLPPTIFSLCTLNIFKFLGYQVFLILFYLRTVRHNGNGPFSGSSLGPLSVSLSPSLSFFVRLYLYLYMNSFYHNKIYSKSLNEKRWIINNLYTGIVVYI